MSDVLLMYVSVAFLFLALIVVIALRDNPKVQLLTLNALSLVLIGLPPFLFHDNALPDAVKLLILSVLVVYPFALTLVRLKFSEAFNRAKNTFIISTVVVFLLYVSVSYAGLLSGYWWSSYPFFLLVPAVPEFLAIFAGDSISAARAILAYESALGLAIFWPSLISSVAFALTSSVIDGFGVVLAVIVALLLWSLFYALTHKGNSADPYALLGFHLLDNLFIWGVFLIGLAYVKFGSLSILAA